MSKINKILLLFPDGVGIRNYLYSNVFSGLKEELVLFHSFDEETAAKIAKITNIDSRVKIPLYKETIKEKFLRELICLLRLKSNAKLTKNKTILSTWKTHHKSLKNKVFYKLIAFFSLFFNSYSQILFLEKKYQKVIRNTSYYHRIKKIVTQINPDIVFCSHQRAIQCATILAVASDLEIKTVAVIYSWDNLPKARLALRASTYLVWSPYMKQEMATYYPEINKNDVIVTGTPQFECYQNVENIIPKKEFYATHNLDFNKKIICFSGDDVRTSPDDPMYLNDLAQELTENGLDQEYQILFRRCPVDVSGRYEYVLKKYPKLIKNVPPIWNFDKSNSWTTIYPLKEDLKLLVSTAFYCDLVINIGSTMVFDFAMFQKSCIFINYDQEKKVNKNWSVKNVYQFQHFRSMPKLETVLWCNRREDFKKLLNEKFNEILMNSWKDTILSDYQNASKKIRESLKLN